MPNLYRARTGELARLRLDAKREDVAPHLGALTVPRGGWLRTIRQALGMSLVDLASRVGISSSTLMRLEKSEQKGSIQLDSLRRLADAMNCDVVYALVPRAPLERIVGEQRKKAARALNRKVRTHMSLEGQHTKDSRVEQWREERAAAMIPDSQLWKASS